MSILNLIRPELLNSQNYVPGGDRATYRLHANELPWSAVAEDSINLNFYPDSQPEYEILKLLANRYRVNDDQIVLTRGSDDGIDLVTRLFLIAGKDALLQFTPTFPMYAFYVRLQQAELIQGTLNESDNFSLSLDQVKKSWKDNCKVIMICSPNNPTANLFDLSFIESVCKEYENRSVVVVDEAYIEFAESPSAASLIDQYENLIVLRTLSKANGLAGIRLGSILAQTHVINAFKKIIAPYTIPSPVADIAKKAIVNLCWFQTAVVRIKQERSKLIKHLGELPIIEKIYPTETNFILVKTTYAKELTTHLAEQGIAIRDFPPNSLLHHHLRISVGDEKQNELLVNALTAFSEG